jgi:hypothetical protein
MPDSVQHYLQSLPADRLEAMAKLRELLQKKLPPGFEETWQYGMITYVVPHSIYPKGYHCKPTDALPFISIASQKAGIHLYHMGIYADPKLMQWFTDAYAKACTTKLDMGKSCIRFKKIDQIPFALIGELAQKMTPQQWIERYEAAFRKN